MKCPLNEMPVKSPNEIPLKCPKTVFVYGMEPTFKIQCVPMVLPIRETNTGYKKRAHAKLLGEGEVCSACVRAQREVCSVCQGVR
jgi:hypothetical protein